MSDSLALINFFYFSAFDQTTKQLMYSKYNFNFTLYNNTFFVPPLTNPEDPSGQIILFRDFLIRNGTTYSAAYTVLPNLTQYFDLPTPVGPDIINYMNTYGYCIHPNYNNTNVIPPTFISSTQLVLDQFNMLPYNDTTIDIVQDYIYYDSSGNLCSKWNFDFDTYSRDFIVYGSKLFIFTDFVTRCIHLSGTTFGINGYGLPAIFNIYFDHLKNFKRQRSFQLI